MVAVGKSVSHYRIREELGAGGAGVAIKAEGDKAWQGFGVPCLFLVGENEKIYSAEAAVGRLKRVAPQVKAEIIPGAGHDLTIAQADLVASKVLAFLGERAGVAATAA